MEREEREGEPKAVLDFRKFCVSVLPSAGQKEQTPPGKESQEAETRQSSLSPQPQ